MINLNLLPDIKQDYVEAKATRDRVVVWSAVVGGSFVGLVVLSLIILGIQWVIVSKTREDIATMTTRLEAEEDISQILTVQRQLLTLPDMHAEKPRMTRLFGYLSTLTPSGISLSSFEADMELHEMQISGSARSMRDLNIYVDTLKGAQYELGPEVDPGDEEFESLATILEEDFSGIDLSEPVKAFRSVVSAISIDTGTGEISFTLTIAFDPAIFDSRYSAVKMSVSSTIDRDTGQSGMSDETLFDGSANGEGQ